MRFKVLFILGLVSLMMVASCDSSSTTKYLEFSTKMLLPQAAIGKDYDFTFTVTYGEDKWDANTGFAESDIVWGFDSWKLNNVEQTQGPANLTFEEGKITGIADPADGGLWSFNVTIEKGKDIIVQTFYLPIAENVEILTDTILPYATTELDYSTYFSAKHGMMPYYWSFDNWAKDGTPVNDPPVGLTFSGAGFIEGKADNSEVGDWTFDVTVYDTTVPGQLNDTKSFELTIKLKLEVPTNYPTIQDAVNAADSGATIYLTPGTYQGTGNRDINFQGKSLTILGDPQNPGSVIIDCEGNSTDPHRAFMMDNGETNCMFDGIRIINGFAPVTSSHNRGGAIYGSSGTEFTVQNCEFEDFATQSVGSSVDVYGGVIYKESYGYLNIFNTSFKNTKAEATGSSSRVYGGNIFVNSNVEFEMDNVEISGTYATANGDYFRGGEIYMSSVNYKISNLTIHDGEYYLYDYNYMEGAYIWCSSCSGTIENSTFANGYMQNSDSSYGYFRGTLGYFSSCSTSFTNCNFVNNSMKYTGSYSYYRLYGMFYLTSGSSTWDDCILANNVVSSTSSPCYYNGGITYMSSHTAKFNRCHFLMNETTSSSYSTSYSYSSGGIAVYSSSTAMINDCVFAYNSFRAGGGAVSVTSTSGTATITNMTSYKNYGDRGGSIFFYSSNVNVNNSILWDNTGSYASEIYGYSTSYTINLANTCYSSNGISGSSNPVSCISTDPYFKDTGDNPVTGDCTFSDVTMTVTGTPGTSAFLTEIMRGDMIYLTADGDTKALVVVEVVSDTELKVAGFYTGTPGTGAATVKKMDFTPQHTSKGDANDSPCVDSGDNSKSSSSVDIAGNTRVVDGNGNSTPTVDMGAYEMQ